MTPSRAYSGDAGWDLTAISVKYSGEEDAHVAHTGIAVEIPLGYVGLLFCRGSIVKKDMLLANAVGVLDSGYRGEITFKFKTIRREHLKIEAGERVGQLVLLKLPDVELVETDELSPSDRGEGAYGSSGK